MTIFNLLGMEIFGHKIKYDEFGKVIDDDSDTEGLSPRPNFDNFYNGFVAVFVIFVGDWSMIMTDHYRSQGSIALAFIPTALINLMLINLFLVNVLEKFREKTVEVGDSDAKSLKHFRRKCLVIVNQTV